jgi:transcriptional regulator with XRE-family HTH domain
MPSGRIGTVLTALREKKGLTQAQLAKRAKVSRGYLADLEAGHRANPSVPTLRRIATALGVPVTRLVERPARAARVELRRFDPARVFPPAAKPTTPLLRLMIAADDVRCARNLYVDAEQRLWAAQGIQRQLISGEKWYALRLLFSHVNEAGDALRTLTSTIGAQAVERYLAGQPDGLTAFRSLRAAFEVDKAERQKSFIWKLRNWIGFHNNGSEVQRVFTKYIGYVDGAVTASPDVGGLTRFLLSDSLAILIFLDAAGANLPPAAQLDRPEILAAFHAELEQAMKRVSEGALPLAGDLTAFVDALVHGLVQERGILSIEQDIIEIPPRLRAAKAAVDSGRLRAL